MATKKQQAEPYGSWKSPITSELIAASGVRLGQTLFDGETLYWLEGRPTEGGRQVIVQMDEDGEIDDFIEPPYNARTLVHEYGGGAFGAYRDTVIFSNFSDQLVYKISQGEEPTAITGKSDCRFADFVFDPARDRVVCIREDHSDPDQEAINTVVALSLDPAHNDQQGDVLVSGSNFYSNARFSTNGKQLCWLSWNHPNMPWDGTELWVAELDADGKIWRTIKVAGGPDESICQPEWLPNGTLCFISDRSGWWNLYAVRDPAAASEALCLANQPNDFGQPQWVFGITTYCCLTSERIICSFNKDGIWQLAEIRLDWQSKDFQLREISTPYTDFGYFTASDSGQRVAMTAGSPTASPAVVELDTENLSTKVLRSSTSLEIYPSYISEAQPISFPTSNGVTAYAFYYPPKNPAYKGKVDELPPLLVKSHGGPTGATSSALNLSIQYWTSRGFAVADVNYGGSTGFGREYRRRLNGNWGVVDVDDCQNAAKFLAGSGKADPQRLAITGGSAGGYTTLCALTFGNVFKAGASHFGVSDLEALCADTHKFESRYDHTLIGPQPESKELLKERSPINFTDKLSCPIIFFQGLEDKVVPPNQAEMMVEALRKKQLPVAYIRYEGEQHGFRKAENIKRTIEAEFYFYSRIFGFEPADQIEPVEIENLEQLVARKR